jgi:hypothetical protein
VPVWIIWVDKTSSVNIELEHGLETTINLFEVFGVSFDFDYFKSLLNRHLSFVVSGFFQGQDTCT